MIPIARLGFAIRQLLWSTAGLEVPESVPSLEVAGEFLNGLAAVDAAMCGRADVQAAARLCGHHQSGRGHAGVDRPPYDGPRPSPANAPI